MKINSRCRAWRRMWQKRRPSGIGTTPTAHFRIGGRRDRMTRSICSTLGAAPTMLPSQAQPAQTAPKSSPSERAFHPFTSSGAITSATDATTLRSRIITWSATFMSGRRTRMSSPQSAIPSRFPATTASSARRFWPACLRSPCTIRRPARLRGLKTAEPTTAILNSRSLTTTETT